MHNFFLSLSTVCVPSLIYIKKKLFRNSFLGLFFATSINTLAPQNTASCKVLRQRIINFSWKMANLDRTVPKFATVWKIVSVQAYSTTLKFREVLIICFCLMLRTSMRRKTLLRPLSYQLLLFCYETHHFAAKKKKRSWTEGSCCYL